jgi:type I restriction enzyme S subunit
MTWKKITFKDFVTLQRGFDLPVSQMQEGEVPVIGSNCIMGYHNIAKIQPPGVITGRSGTLGVVQYSDQPYWPHNTALWVKDFKGNHPKFVYYFLRTLHLERFNRGTSVPTLNRNVLTTLEVRIPDYPEQEKIALLLSQYDNLIDNNLTRMELLEQLARLLYQEWFVQLRFPGYEHTRIVNGIPDKWQKGTVSDLGKIITGKTPSKKDPDNFGGKIPFIKIPDMHGNSIVIITEDSLSEKGAKSQEGTFLPENSILVSCIGTVGVVALNGYRAQTNQQINSIVPFKNYLRYFTYFCMIENRQKMVNLGGGSIMGNINKTKFSELSIILPSESLLSQFQQYVEPNFNQIKTLSIINQKLRSARDLLLPKLMNGELPV